MHEPIPLLQLLGEPIFKKHDEKYGWFSNVPNFFNFLYFCYVKFDSYAKYTYVQTRPFHSLFLEEQTT